MPRETRVEQLHQALTRGESFTRVEACERFGITGSTFRWAIKTFRERGAQLQFETEPGRRRSIAKRWRLAIPHETTSDR